MRCRHRRLTPKTCTVGQGTGWHGLSFKVLKTGLMRNSTVFSMSMVANHGSRLSFWYNRRFLRAQGGLVRKYTMNGLRGPFVHQRKEVYDHNRAPSAESTER